MIPLWKINRELTRVGLHLKAIPELVLDPIRQQLHDKRRNSSLKPAFGSIGVGSKIALLLIYQPRGLNKSILLTCKHLVENGYSPLVVSNTKLSDRDKSALLAVAWCYFERPNYGYDFGGYRDGIWFLNKMEISPENLVIMNDSVWFPIHRSSSLIEQMEASKSEYIGTQVFNVPGNNGSKGKRRQMFFGSYFFMIKRSAFLSVAFQNFWKDYRQTSNKETTLKRGERAFSYAMFTAGISSEGIYSRSKFDSAIASLSHSELEHAIETLVCPNQKLEKRRLAMLTRHNTSQEIRSLVSDAARSKNFIGSSPVLSINFLGFPMIKKNNEILYRKARKTILRAIDQGLVAEIHPTIQQEMLDRENCAD